MMIKGVLIYNSNSGQHVYNRYAGRTLQVNPEELAAFIHVIRAIAKNADPEIKEGIKDMEYNNFVINLEEGLLSIKDLSGIHNKIHFHDYCHYSGVFSVNERVPYELTESIFKAMISPLPEDKLTKIGLSTELKRELDDILLIANGTQ